MRRLLCFNYFIYLFLLYALQPKIQVASKYERRVDTRSYDDKKKLFEGVSITFHLNFLCHHNQTKFTIEQNCLAADRFPCNYNSIIFLRDQGYDTLFKEVAEKKWQEKQERFMQRSKCKRCFLWFVVLHTQNLFSCSLRRVSCSLPSTLFVCMEH